MLIQEAIAELGTSLRTNFEIGISKVKEQIQGVDSKIERIPTEEDSNIKREMEKAAYIIKFQNIPEEKKESIKIY